MNHFVPDFDSDDDYVHNPHSSSSLNLPTKSIMSEENDLTELLWHNGQVVVQNQRPNNNTKKPSSSSIKLHGWGGDASPPPPPPMHQQQPLDQNLFIQEDEMTSWLQYPLREDDFCSDLLFSSASAIPSAPCATTTTTTSQVTAARPPVPSSNEPRPPVKNFMNFSRLRGNFTGGNGKGESGPSISKAIVRESTHVSPNATPSSVASESGLTRRTDAIDSQVTTVKCGSSSAVAGGSAFNISVLGPNWKGKAVATPAAAPANEIPPGKSSSVVSNNEIKPETEKTIVDERKRKEREGTEETESRSEETKQARGSSSSTKRSRAAEVHNLSERKRRDRINERMKALQELIPRCNKSDKASMLDEAIEYMKSLQLQIQMMSMGCGMMPMMYTGMQQYMPMGAAFMPYPNMLPTQRPLPTQTHMGGSVFSALHYPVHTSDPSRVFLPNQQCDPTSSQPHYPGYIDPYQQFRNLHPTQPRQFQNQATSFPSSSRVSSSKESEDQGNHTTG